MKSQLDPSITYQGLLAWVILVFPNKNQKTFSYEKRSQNSLQQFKTGISDFPAPPLVAACMFQGAAFSTEPCPTPVTALGPSSKLGPAGHSHPKHFNGITECVRLEWTTVASPVPSPCSSRVTPEHRIVSSPEASPARETPHPQSDRSVHSEEVLHVQAELPGHQFPSTASSSYLCTPPSRLIFLKP